MGFSHVLWVLFGFLRKLKGKKAQFLYATGCIWVMGVGYCLLGLKYFLLPVSFQQTGGLLGFLSFFLSPDLLWVSDENVKYTFNLIL